MVLKYQNLNKGCPCSIVEGYRGGKLLMHYKAYVLQLHSVKDLCSVGAQRCCRFSWHIIVAYIYNVSQDIRTAMALCHASDIYECKILVITQRTLQQE